MVWTNNTKAPVANADDLSKLMASKRLLEGSVTHAYLHLLTGLTLSAHVEILNKWWKSMHAATD